MRPKLGRIFSIFQEVYFIRIIREKDPSMAIRAKAPVQRKQPGSSLPRQRALKLARDQFTKKIRESAQPGSSEQQDKAGSSYAVDSTQQAAQFVGSKAAGTVKGSAQKAKMAIQKRQKLIKERKAQAAEEKARSEGAGQREPETGGDGMRYGTQEQPVLADNTPAYHNGMQARAGIEAGPAPHSATRQEISAGPVPARPASAETAVRRTETYSQPSPMKESSTGKNQSIHQSVQPPARGAGRSPIKEHNSGAFAPKEKPVRGPSAIKSRRAEESIKAMGNPIKAGKPGAFEKRPGRPGPGNIPRRKAIASGRKRAGRALIERAAQKMKLHSQKQLAQKAGKAAKAAGTVTKKAAVMTVRAARALVSALAGIVGGTGGFILLAVVLLGGALSAFGSSPGSGVYTPVSAEVEAFDPIIRIYAAQHGIPEYVDLIKAVMMQESGGNVELVGGDVMQCAEGMGLPVGTPVDPERSIDFGTSIIANNLQLAGATGPGDIPHISLALQGYNFGNGYISWALARGGYSKDNAREFSIWQAGIHGWSGYGDIDYVDHVLRYYPLAANPLGGASAIAEGRFAFPFPGHTWDTYPGHNGIDISFADCYGEPVYACAPGTVRYIQDGWTPAHGVSNMWSFGNCVVVDHTEGWQSVYAHLSRLAVTPGTPIRQGQLVGYIGSTGNSTGPHLHLALYYHGSPGENGMNYAEMAWPQYRE